MWRFTKESAWAHAINLEKSSNDVKIFASEEECMLEQTIILEEYKVMKAQLEDTNEDVLSARTNIVFGSWYTPQKIANISCY